MEKKEARRINENPQPDDFRDIHRRIVQQTFPEAAQVIIVDDFIEGEAVSRPEKGTGDTPHLVADEVAEAPGGKCQQPDPMALTVEPPAERGEEDGKEQGMAENPPIA